MMSSENLCFVQKTKNEQSNKGKKCYVHEESYFGEKKNNRIQGKYKH